VLLFAITTVIGADLYKLVPGHSIGKRDAKGVEGVGNRKGAPSPADGAWGSIELPQRGPGQMGFSEFLVVKMHPDNNNLHYCIICNCE